jgi:hypothetical protein
VCVWLAESQWLSAIKGVSVLCVLSSFFLSSFLFHFFPSSPSAFYLFSLSTLFLLLLLLSTLFCCVLLSLLSPHSLCHSLHPTKYQPPLCLMLMHRTTLAEPEDATRSPSTASPPHFASDPQRCQCTPSLVSIHPSVRAVHPFCVYILKSPPSRPASLIRSEHLLSPLCGIFSCAPLMQIASRPSQNSVNAMRALFFFSFSFWFSCPIFSVVYHPPKEPSPPSQRSAFATFCSASLLVLCPVYVFFFSHPSACSLFLPPLSVVLRTLLFTSPTHSNQSARIETDHQTPPYYIGHAYGSSQSTVTAIAR